MKKILMIATGGTIASLDQGDGLSPAITSAQLLSAVPEVSEICEAEAMQLMNLDSTNMTPEGWLRIAEQIRRSYDDYDGFVVTHGTDTMAYTAAALSYLIQKSPKPIVMTGSQKSIFLRDTDARQNVQDSFRYAVFPGAQGVSLVFDGKVILGTRARKERTKSGLPGDRCHSERKGDPLSSGGGLLGRPRVLQLRGREDPGPDAGSGTDSGGDAPLSSGL